MSEQEMRVIGVIKGGYYLGDAQALDEFLNDLEKHLKKKYKEFQDEALKNLNTPSRVSRDKALKAKERVDLLRELSSTYNLNLKHR